MANLYWPRKTQEEMPVYNAVLQTADEVLGSSNTQLMVTRNYMTEGHIMWLAPSDASRPIREEDANEIAHRLREHQIFNSYNGLAFDPSSGWLSIDLRGFTDTPVKEAPLAHVERPSEMANYIEIDKYNRYEAGHPGYTEMMNRIVDQVVALVPRGETTGQVAEIGAGTGELTRRLGNTLRLHTDAVEIDGQCSDYLHHKMFHSNGEIINAALRARNFFDFAAEHRDQYNAVTSSFADHHFPPEKKREFLQVISSILRKGGAYIVGDEFLPPHDESDPAQRVAAQMQYHGMIIREAFKEGKVELPKLELDALISGLRTTVPFIQ